ncbi:cell wall protein [Enterococcus spodopteracolus]|uniref:cell wall protein n=1 Tax=Enterococcus spodopteracolus TaxID=3034501 RepID=UPI002648C16C|nr:cell wall protein [Enterococcus spodopteracolus]
MNRMQKRKKKIQSKVFRKSAVVATLATVLIAPTVLAATNGLNELDGDKIVQYANESANFTWNDNTDKWNHGNLMDAKTVTIGNAKIGIYSQEEGYVTVAAGEAQYSNDYMAAPMATIPVVAGTTQYATIDLSDTGSGEILSGIVTVAVTFSDGEDPTPTPDKPQAPSNITFNDTGDFVTAWVGANTSTSVYDASGNKIDDGAMYMETEGQASFDLVRKLAKGEQIYVVSINPDTQVESEKTWTTFMPVTAKTAVTIMGMDRDSGETLWSTVQELDADTMHTLTADTVEGYELVSPASEDVYVTGDFMTHVFYYVKKEVSPEAKTGTIRMNYVDLENNPIADSTLHEATLGEEVSINAKDIEGYMLLGDSTWTITLEEEGISDYYFVYAKNEEQAVEVTPASDVQFVEESNGSQISAKVEQTLFLVIVKDGEILAQKQAVSNERATIIDLTVDLSREIAEGDSVEYYTMDSEGNKS